MYSSAVCRKAGQPDLLEGWRYQEERAPGEAGQAGLVAVALTNGRESRFLAVVSVEGVHALEETHEGMREW